MKVILVIFASFSMISSFHHRTWPFFLRKTFGSRQLTSIIGAGNIDEFCIVKQAEKNTLLSKLLEKRPNLIIQVNPSISEDSKFIWHIERNGIQLDSTILEEQYLGKQKLNDEETVQQWESTITKRLNLLTDDGSMEILGHYGEFQNELEIAILAVQRACFASRSFQKKFFSDKSKSISKKDSSPVTISDFTVQALIINILSKNFPNDSFIAEESSEVLKTDLTLTNQILESLQAIDDTPWNQDLLFDTIDKGGQSPVGKKRSWVLDPIDGTKGFIRGEHFCIALALLVDGEPKLSIMGCPNLNIYRVLQGSSYDQKPIEFVDKPYYFEGDKNPTIFNENLGSLFFAANNMGAFVRGISMPLKSAFEVNVSPKTDAKDAILCESAEASFGNRVVTKKLADILQIKNKYIAIDGLCKSCIVGAGTVEGTLRVPPLGYRENIWDIVAGYHFIREAGGKVTDLEGNDLVFKDRRVLDENVRGIVSSNGLLHDSILKALKYAKDMILNENQ